MKAHKYIKAVRKELGLTQTEMAKKLSTTKKTIIQWEKGRTLNYITLLVYERFANDEGINIEKPEQLQ